MIAMPPGRVDNETIHHRKEPKWLFRERTQQEGKPPKVHRRWRRRRAGGLSPLALRRWTIRMAGCALIRGPQRATRKVTGRMNAVGLKPFLIRRLSD